MKGKSKSATALTAISLTAGLPALACAENEGEDWGAILTGTAFIGTVLFAVIFAVALALYTRKLKRTRLKLAFDGTCLQDLPNMSRSNLARITATSFIAAWVLMAGFLAFAVAADKLFV